MKKNWFRSEVLSLLSVVVFASLVSFSVAVKSANADDHGNSCGTATAVSLPGSRAGVINTAGDIDYFRIQVPSAGTLTVYTTGSTDTYGKLKNAACITIAANDDYNGTNFRISSFVAAGTYYVEVRHYSPTATGAYTFYGGLGSPSSDDHGNNCASATSVGLPGSRAGVIGSAGDVDYFRITVPSAGTLSVYTTGSTDTYGSLKDANCTAIAANDDYRGGLNFRISRPVTAGTYFVEVRHYSSSGTGSYVFLAEDPWPVTNHTTFGSTVRPRPTPTAVF